MAEGKKLISNNTKAYHDYFIEQTYECGVELFGTEVKSLRLGQCNFRESFVRIKDHEVFVYGMYIAPYEKGNIFNKDPLRIRKLLMHKREILRLEQKVNEKGYTLVPTQCYFTGGRVKVEIALAKGKKLFDKRDALQEKQTKRDIEREFRERNK